MKIRVGVPLLLSAVLGVGLAPTSLAQTTMQTIYSEDFESINLGAVPEGWTERYSSIPFGGDTTFGVTSDHGTWGTSGANSLRQARVGSGGVASTPEKCFRVPLAPHAPGTTLHVQMSFLYRTVPIIGNNFFTWTFGDGDDVWSAPSFRTAVEVGKYGFSAMAGEGYQAVGDAVTREGQWQHLQFIYQLGSDRAIIRVNQENFEVPVTTPILDPISSDFCSATNFAQFQTGAIYVDDLKVDVLLDIPAALSTLARQVEELSSISAGQTTSLVNILQAVRRSETGSLAAEAQLDVFARHVKRLIGSGTIAADEGAALLERVNHILNLA